jgi:hypothetical protein
MMAMTTSNSISVKPGRNREAFFGLNISIVDAGSMIPISH